MGAQKGSKKKVLPVGFELRAIRSCMGSKREESRRTEWHFPSSLIELLPWKAADLFCDMWVTYR